MILLIILLTTTFKQEDKYILIVSVLIIAYFPVLHFLIGLVYFLIFPCKLSLVPFYLVSIVIFSIFSLMYESPFYFVDLIILVMCHLSNMYFTYDMFIYM